MWIVSPRGFFSIVQKEWDFIGGTLTVRARVRDDLVWFGMRCKDAGPIEEDSLADYPFRLQAPADAVAQVIQRLVAGIDYGNVKDATKARKGPERAAIYAGAWAALLKLNPPAPAPIDPLRGTWPWQRLGRGPDGMPVQDRVVAKRAKKAKRAQGKRKR